MSQISKVAIKEACQLSFKDELQKLSKINIDNIVHQSLSDEQVGKVAEKITLLPLEYRNILFFRYCFNATPSETEKILDIENSISKLRYIKKMLSELLGLNNLWIDDDSVKRACQIALAGETRNYDSTPILYKPNYSKSLRLKLKDIKIKENPNNTFMLIAKRVAAFILVSILSFSAVLVTNVEARENVFGWVVETFPEFSIFTPKVVDQDSKSVDLTSIKINYIPKRFEMVNIHEGRKMLIYNFIGENDQQFTVKLYDLSGEGKSYYDTENSEIKEIIFKGSPAYTWEADKIIYLIWNQDSIECHISGNLKKGEILKIAENICK